MNYLFWNVNKKNINEKIKEVIIQYKCDVIILAEYESNMDDLIKSLHNTGYNFYPLKQLSCEKIHIITKFIPEKIKRLTDGSRYTIEAIPHDKIHEINIVSVHLPSKLNSGNDIRLSQVRKIKNKLEQIENKYNNKNSIIVGDFNMNPFEEPMVSADGIHSLSSRNLSEKIRKIDDEEYDRFYNPMWNLLGDNNNPEGTYYYSGSDMTSYYWNIFDQVIIRPNIIEYFDMDSLKIIKSINGVSLLKKSGIPNKDDFSDHLPLYFKIS